MYSVYFQFLHTNAPKKTKQQKKPKTRKEKQPEKGYALLKVIPQYCIVHPLLRLKSM